MNLAPQVRAHLAMLASIAAGVREPWPFTPMGAWQKFRFLRIAGDHVVALPMEALRRRELWALFGRAPASLAALFPGDQPGAWDADRAAEAVAIACSAAGLREPESLGFSTVGWPAHTRLLPQHPPAAPASVLFATTTA